MIHSKKRTDVGLFSACDDPTIKMSNIFDKMRLLRSLRPLRLLRAVEVIEAAEILRPDKSLLRTSESSRFLNSALL
jgi:hypothetical protein